MDHLARGGEGGGLGATEIHGKGGGTTADIDLTDGFRGVCGGVAVEDEATAVDD